MSERKFAKLSGIIPFISKDGGFKRVIASDARQGIFYQGNIGSIPL